VVLCNVEWACHSIVEINDLAMNSILQIRFLVFSFCRVVVRVEPRKVEWQPAMVKGERNSRTSSTFVNERRKRTTIH